MKNIIDEKPTTDPHGRLLYCTRFVSDDDIKNKRILDIGCGFGWFELNAIKRKAKHIIGIETTNNDLKTAKKSIKNDKVSFQIGSALKLPFKDKSFDTVVSWEVLEHIPKNGEKRMFQEVHRVLKPNGIFYLSTPNQSVLSNVLDPAWWLINHRHYTMGDLIALSEKNGFKVEKIVTRGSWWEIIGINNLYVSKWIFRRKPFFERNIQGKQDKEYQNNYGFTNIFIKSRRT